MGNIKKKRMNQSDYEFEDDFEDWEAIAEFTDANDWEGLVKWSKTNYDKYPNEHYYQYQYSNALIQNKEYQKAMEVLTKAYKIHFDSPDIDHSILTVLFATGKNESNFPWTEPPPDVLRLDNDLIKICKDYLKGKRKHRSLSDILSMLYTGCYFLTFSEEELGTFLYSSGKFDTGYRYKDDKNVINSIFKNKLKR